MNEAHSPQKAFAMLFFIASFLPQQTPTHPALRLVRPLPHPPFQVRVALCGP